MKDFHVKSILILVTLSALIYSSYQWIVYSRFAANRKITILAFGDSLTEGNTRYQNRRARFPYTLQLKKRISKDFPNMEVTVVNRGIAGDKAANMAARLKKALKERKFDIAVILAGTNDYIQMVRDNQDTWARQDLKVAISATVSAQKLLRINRTSNVIMRDILLLHKHCHYNDVKTVALTIPEIDFEQNKDLGVYFEHRNKINEKLEFYAQRFSKQTIFVDLASEMPLLNLTPEKRKKYWADGLHFTRKGYGKVADIIYKKIKNTIKEISYSKR